MLHKSDGKLQGWKSIPTVLRSFALDENYHGIELREEAQNELFSDSKEKHRERDFRNSIILSIVEFSRLMYAYFY